MLLYNSQLQTHLPSPGKLLSGGAQQLSVSNTEHLQTAKGQELFSFFLLLLKLQLAKASAKVYAQVWLQPFNELSRAKINHYSRNYELRALTLLYLIFNKL